MKIKGGLVVESLPDGGCLILDDGQQQSHALRPEATAVWRCLERGDSEVDGIARATSLEPQVVETALAELEAAGLIETEAAGSSRREWLARAATVAGAAVGLKLIETIVTPSPAAAQTLPDQPDGG